jgi:hypothetical protein
VNKACMTHFKNPPSAFRGKPFWAWNGKLDPLELKRQIRIMKRMGLGGFFIHSRVGLDTPYLSSEWLECIDACVAEAKKQNMEAWLYDEDRWPSGAAGGLVTRNKQFRMRKLYVKVHTNPKMFAWTKDVAAAYCVTLYSGTMTAFTRLAKNQKPKTLAPDQSILSFTEVIEGDDDWYNGQAYLDTMNPKAVDAFIKTTHELYRKRYGKEFGTLIPGIFTDEPNHGEFLAGWAQNETTLGVIPWTIKLPAVFKERYGYDILDHLPTLVYDVKGEPGNQPRYHFHDCTTFLFVNSFAKQIGQWCAKNNIMFTGHVLEEDWLSTQANKVGSAMRFYEYMQAPGMDLLTDRKSVV